MISFVYFDVGGVVMLDFSGTNKWDTFKKDLGIPLESFAAFDAVWDQYDNELSTIRDVDSLIPIFQQEMELTFSKTYSMLSDIVGRFESNPPIHSVIRKIQKKSRVGLLTNQYPRMFPIIEKRGLLPAINWDILIDSSVIGIKKPEPDIFLLAQEKAKVQSEEILFVDNTKVNIDAAEKLGWRTFLYDPSQPKVSSKKLLAYFQKLTR